MHLPPLSSFVYLWSSITPILPSFLHLSRPASRPLYIPRAASMPSLRPSPAPSSPAATAVTIVVEDRKSKFSSKCSSYYRVCHILLSFGPRPFVLAFLLLFSPAIRTQYLIYTDETSPRTIKTFRLVAVQASSILAVSSTLPIGRLLQLRALVKVSIASVARRKLSACRSSAGHPHPNCSGRQRAVLPNLQMKSKSPSRSKSWHCREVSGRNLYLSRLRTTERVHVCQD